jgi:P-type Mg2+ transporter
MVVCYLGLIELGKRIFYGVAPTTSPDLRRPSRHRHQRRRAARFSTATR